MKIAKAVTNEPISEAEMEALAATFTELASSAGRVAASLAKINALAEETHAELHATWQALTPLNPPEKPCLERHG